MKWLVVLVALGSLIFAACSGSSDGGGEATTEPEPTEAAADPTEAPTEAPAPAATEAPASGPSARPETPTAAALEISYNTATGTFDALVMGIAEGDVEAQWYQADGFYVVVFEGLDLDATAPLCPGASIQVPSGAYEFVANVPTEGADCSTFPTLSADPAVQVLTCEGVVSFRTAIPASSEGTLFGTLERPVEGGLTGITSMTPTSAGAIPEVDVSLLSC